MKVNTFVDGTHFFEILNRYHIGDVKFHYYRSVPGDSQNFARSPETALCVRFLNTSLNMMWEGVFLEVQYFQILHGYVL